MADFSAVAVIPTNSTVVYLNKQAGQTVQYSQLVGSTYATLATFTYGGLQNLGPTNAEVMVLPTNKAVVYMSKERTLANYTSIAVSWGTTYAALTGLSYGQLGVIP